MQAKEAALEDLKAEIAAAKQALADRKKKSEEQGPSRFSLVPFRGSGGTFRRPIYLECLENQIRLQPLGITLTKQDFALPIRAGNPLDVALLTIQEHWQELDVAGDQGSPYPLLVVRPGGAETFVLARRAMKSWADEFGYELVDAEKDLDFGTTDTVLASKVTKVIKQSIERQLQLARQNYARQRHLAQFASNRASPGFSVGKRGAGLIPNQSSAGRGRVVSPAGFDSNRATSGSGGGSATARQTNFLSGGGPNSQGGSTGATGEYAGSRSGSNQNSQFQSGSARSGGQGSSQNFSASNSNYSNSGSSSGTGSSNGQPNNGQSNGGTGASNQFASQGNSAGQNSSQSGAQGGNSQQLGSPASSTSSSPNLANRRGSGWALPSRNQGGTGYLRPITVVCSANHLQIKTAEGTNRTIDFESGSVAAVDVMVEEIWKRIASWGIAGQGSFWKPQLRIQVAPGGEARFAALQHMLQNSGLVIEAGAKQ